MQARTYFDSADWQLSKQQSAAHGADGMAVQSVAANDWRALQALVAQPSDAATAARATQQQAAATTRHHHYQQQQLGMPGVVTGTMPLKNKVVRRPSRLGTATNATCHVQC